MVGTATRQNGRWDSREGAAEGTFFPSYVYVLFVPASQREHELVSQPYQTALVTTRSQPRQNLTGAVCAPFVRLLLAPPLLVFVYGVP